MTYSWKLHCEHLWAYVLATVSEPGPQILTHFWNNYYLSSGTDQHCLWDFKWNRKDNNPIKHGKVVSTVRFVMNKARDTLLHKYKWQKHLKIEGWAAQIWCVWLKTTTTTNPTTDNKTLFIIEGRHVNPEVDTVAPLLSNNWCRIWLQMTSPGQNGSTHFLWILPYFLNKEGLEEADNQY